MAQFMVVHLRDAQLADAYPLVQLAVPEASFDQWQDFARAAIRADGGVIGLFAGNANLHGVAAYRPDRTLLCDHVLRVEPLVTLELNESSPARAALCEALELLALAKGCERLRVQIASRGCVDPASRRLFSWMSAGLSLEEVTLDKQVSKGFDAVRAIALASNR